MNVNMQYEVVFSVKLTMQTKSHIISMLSKTLLTLYEVKMLREERLRNITQQLVLKRSIICNELAKEFEVNVATIRFDLSELERRGLESVA